MSRRISANNDSGQTEQQQRLIRLVVSETIYRQKVIKMAAGIALILCGVYAADNILDCISANVKPEDNVSIARLLQKIIDKGISVKSVPAFTHLLIDALIVANHFHSYFFRHYYNTLLDFFVVSMNILKYLVLQFFLPMVLEMSILDQTYTDIRQHLYATNNQGLLNTTSINELAFTQFRNITNLNINTVLNSVGVGSYTVDLSANPQNNIMNAVHFLINSFCIITYLLFYYLPIKEEQAIHDEVSENPDQKTCVKYLYKYLLEKPFSFVAVNTFSSAKSLAGLFGCRQNKVAPIVATDIPVERAQPPRRSSRIKA